MKLIISRIIELAKKEGSLQLKGNVQKAGSQIEKYLSKIRQHLVTVDQNYHDLNKGFDWCGAYVYYIITQSGITLPPFYKSSNFGFVKTWKKWAKENNLLVSPKNKPTAGDLVIFDKLVSEHGLDHMGIIVDVSENSIICSEGNINNQTDIVKREIDSSVNCFIRIKKAS